MSILKYEVLYYLDGDSLAVVEIKKLALPAESDEQKYFWLKISKHDQSIQTLTFKSMSQDTVNNIEFEVREFEEAELKFDTQFGRFIYDDTLYLLTRLESDKLPDSLRSAVKIFLGL